MTCNFTTLPCTGVEQPSSWMSVLHRTGLTADHLGLFMELMKNGAYISGGFARIVGRCLFQKQEILPFDDEPTYRVSRYLYCHRQPTAITPKGEYSATWKSGAGDIDFWFRTAEQATHSLQLLNRYCAASKVPPQWIGSSPASWAHEILWNRIIIQMIHKIYGAPQDLLSNFDLHNAMCYLDESGFHYTKDWFRYESRNELGINKIDSCSILWRVNKWCSKHHLTLSKKSEEAYIEAMTQLHEKVSKDPEFKRYGEVVTSRNFKSVTASHVQRMTASNMLLASMMYDSYDRNNLFKQMVSNLAQTG